MIWHVDFDKAHRCSLRPDCDGYVSSEETGCHFKRWHVYTCGTCGLRVAKGLLIPTTRGRGTPGGRAAGRS